MKKKLGPVNVEDTLDIPSMKYFLYSIQIPSVMNSVDWRGN